MDNHRLGTHHWLSSKEGVGNSNPSSASDGLDWTNVVVGGLGKDSSECDGGGDGCKEDEEGHSDGLLVKVGHLLDPPSANGSLEVLDDSPSAGVGTIVLTVSVSVLGSFFFCVAHCILCCSSRVASFVICEKDRSLEVFEFCF